MKLSELVGQERAVHLLQRSLASGRVHHAWLFAGPDGVGKESAARAFAAALLCTARASDGVDACGACEACLRLGRSVHPDLLEVMPEAEAVARGRLAREDLSGTASRELKIEQLRRLEQQLAIAPLEGGARPVLLLQADAMAAPAQNAFLKTLEEPPKGTVLILVASSSDRLLGTIRSRCQLVPFGPLPARVLEERLRSAGHDAASASLITALAGGSLGRALATKPAQLEDRRTFLQQLDGLDPRDLRSALRLAMERAEKGRDGVADDLVLAALFYRDVAVRAEGLPVEALVHRDLAPLVDAAVARGPAEALRRVKLALRARDAVLRNAAPRLQLEQLVLSYVLPAEVAA